VSRADLAWVIGRTCAAILFFVVLYFFDDRTEPEEAEKVAEMLGS